MSPAALSENLRSQEIFEFLNFKKSEFNEFFWDACWFLLDGGIPNTILQTPTLLQSRLVGDVVWTQRHDVGCPVAKQPFVAGCSSCGVHSTPLQRFLLKYGQSRPTSLHHHHHHAHPNTTAQWPHSAAAAARNSDAAEAFFGGGWSQDYLPKTVGSFQSEKNDFSAVCDFYSAATNPASTEAAVVNCALGANSSDELNPTIQFQTRVNDFLGSSCSKFRRTQANIGQFEL